MRREPVVAEARLAKPSALIISLLICGCAAANKEKFTYEYIPPEKAAIDVVDSTAPSFTVQYADEHYATERLMYFAQSILKSTPTSGGRNTVTGEATIMLGSANYIYTIRKAPTSEGVQYAVSCTSRSEGMNETAMRNAKNLARFVQSGQFERQGLTL